jgi:Holliday junction resolvasome RuvABC endonuclease subunit
MNSKNIGEIRILAIAPCVQGIGFIVFNGPHMPIDWGVKWTRDEKNKKGVAKIAELIDRYQPGMVVFEDPHGEGSRRAQRIQDLLDEIASMVRRRKIAIARYSRAQVRCHFTGDSIATKYRIAKAIAQYLPDLAPRLPAERKIWLPEHANMSIFDAASLALTHFSAITQEAGSSLQQAA